MNAFLSAQLGKERRQDYAEFNRSALFDLSQRQHVNLRPERSSTPHNRELRIIAIMQRSA
jgi:hypothetical protein